MSRTFCSGGVCALQSPEVLWGPHGTKHVLLLWGRTRPAWQRGLSSHFQLILGLEDLMLHLDQSVFIDGAGRVILPAGTRSSNAQLRSAVEFGAMGHLCQVTIKPTCQAQASSPAPRQARSQALRALDRNPMKATRRWAPDHAEPLRDSSPWSCRAGECYLLGTSQAEPADAKCVSNILTLDTERFWNVAVFRR